MSNLSLGASTSNQSPKHFRCCHPFILPRGGSCPADSLPFELLSRIFQLGAEIGLHGDGDVQQSTTLEITEEKAEDSTNANIKQIDESSNDTRVPLPFQIVVSHVCQYWRDVAISTASLWTSISISLVSQLPCCYVATLLERSKCLPIDIRVHPGSQVQDIPSKSGVESTPSNEDLKLLYSLLVAHIHRWRFIQMKVSNQHMYAFLNAAANPTVTAAPQFVSVGLSVNTPAGADGVFWYHIVAGRFTLFGGSAPRLQSVSLERVPINWSQELISYASCLTTLELRRHSNDVSPSWDEFLAILRGAPALEHLVLHGLEPRGDPPNLDTDPNLETVVSNASTPIQLLKLTHLSSLVLSPVCVYGLLHAVHMPALRSLTLDFFWDDYTLLLWFIAAPAAFPTTLSAMEQPRSLLRDLETFSIKCLLCPIEVIEALYDELENVTSLEISIGDLFHSPPSSTLILPLFPPAMPGHSAVNPRLPRLETLTVLHSFSDQHNRLICQVLQERHEAGFPLKSLYIKDALEVYLEDDVWLKEILERLIYSYS